MRVLLVSPDSDNERLWISGDEDPGATVMNNMVPLGLATVAALTPTEHQVDIWDEIIHGRIEKETNLSGRYDVVGVTGFKTHMPRCKEIARICRDHGIPIAVGGPGVSGTPDAYRGDFDILFIGEVEHIWPEFIEDWQSGTIKNEYRQIVKPALDHSPMPRWDSIVGDLNKYAMGCVQTTRGCPFDCEFCDVIYLFGRRARHKPIDRVLDEVRVLERLGMTSVFFCDDEFIGDPKYAKDLLRALIPLNNSFARPLTFSTQLTMNLSKSEELLELMADANFSVLFIGIETPNKDSLKETNKHQNVRKDLAGDVHKILSYGLFVRAGIIIGFDHDGASIFDKQYEFIQDACLPSVAINMLKAPLGTRLWSRLRRQGRVITLANLKDRLGHARSYTNIIPERLSRIELMEGYRDLLLRTHGWGAFKARMTNLISLVRRRPNVREEMMSTEEAERLCFLPSVSCEGRQVIREIIEHAWRVSPFMIRRLTMPIIQFAKYRETLDDLIPQIDRQIELERTGAFPLDPDDRPIMIPDEFRLAHRKLFPPVYRRVYANLQNKSRVPEALIEVFVDFLVRWGGAFREEDAQHGGFLDEIVDRTCARLNGVAPQEFVPVEPANTEIRIADCNRMGEDILKCVEQELIRSFSGGYGGDRRE
ncbi:MAG: radical SAM protein [Planctomycetota bacterium]